MSCKDSGISLSCSIECALSNEIISSEPSNSLSFDDRIHKACVRLHPNFHVLLMQLNEADENFRIGIHGTYKAWGDNIIIRRVISAFTRLHKFDSSKMEVSIPNEHIFETFRIINKGGPMQVFAVDCPSKYGVFGVLWTAETVLANFVAKHSDWFRKKSVIELGGATGVAGITCSLCGSDPVFLTDQEELTRLLERNVVENINLLSNLSAPGGLFVAEHTWGTLRQLQAKYSPFTAAGDVEAPQTFDIILAGDVLYDPAYYGQYTLTLCIVSTT
jgi:predicted nicotinamide N-methyase